MSVGSSYCCLRLKGRLDLNFFLAATLVCGEAEHGIVVQARISSKLSPTTNLQKHGRSFTGDRPVNSLAIQKTESEVHRAPVPRPNQRLVLACPPRHYISEAATASRQTPAACIANYLHQRTPPILSFLPFPSSPTISSPAPLSVEYTR